MPSRICPSVHPGSAAAAAAFAGARRAGLLVMLAAGLAGCTTVSIQAPGAWQGTQTFVGIVRVQAAADRPAPAAEPVQRLSLEAVGLRIDAGLTLGYLHDTRLAVPADCRLVILVRNAAELRHAEALLRQTTQEPLCTVPLR